MTMDCRAAKGTADRHGVSGMTERVRLFGGHVDAGSAMELAGA